MRPHDDYRNGDGGAGGATGAASASGSASRASRSGDSDSEGEEASALEQELSLVDPEAPARALNALNALRKARQHYDVLLAAAGEELAAHRAVLAAASPRLLEALGAGGGAETVRVAVEADALRELLEYAYTGRLRVRDAAHARRLYLAAARLRVEAARAHLAERLLRRVAPHDALQLRALPDLEPHHRAHLDKYIAQNFDEICESGALAALPLVRVELLRETSCEGGEEAAGAVADAALAWLRDRHAPHLALEELCSRTHLLFVDAGGALRDCGELPEARGDAPELQEYRREAQERAARRRPDDSPPPDQDSGGECCVIAARAAAGGAGVTRAVLVLRGALAAARVAWRAGGAEGPRGGRLGGARDEPAPEPECEARARLAVGRCAVGAGALGGRLLVCGGYDRARVLRSAEAYDPRANAWSALPDMRRPRARFPAARLGSALYVFGGSDGQTELDSVDVYEEEAEGAGGGAWRTAGRLPAGGLVHAAAAADEARGALFVLGGWAAGRSLRAVHKYRPGAGGGAGGAGGAGQWEAAPALRAGRSQCAAVVWEDALWVFGGCDAWNCVASTEMLPLTGDRAVWIEGPALPTARRSMGAAVWRGHAVIAGGSAGGASLRATASLAPGGAWRPGAALRRPRAAPALAALGDALYAAGGYTGKEFLACVECLYEPDGEWTTLCSPPSPRKPLQQNQEEKEPEKPQENGASAQEGEQ